MLDDDRMSDGNQVTCDYGERRHGGEPAMVGRNDGRQAGADRIWPKA
jgi:hypothetical protein